ncbi:hypothetical protein M422DRAFT_165121, partial [Sphaerobolus stellatus SS14]
VIEVIYSMYLSIDSFTTLVTNHDQEFFGEFWISTVIASLLGGEVYLVEDLRGNVLGASVWFPPGREMYDSEDQPRQALSILIGCFTIPDPALWEWWGTKFLPQYEEFTTSVLGGVKRDSWHLQTIGVAPEHQRKGIAKALINAVKEKVRLPHTIFLCARLILCNTSSGKQRRRKPLLGGWK